MRFARGLRRWLSWLLLMTQVASAQPTTNVQTTHPPAGPTPLVSAATLQRLIATVAQIQAHYVRPVNDQILFDGAIHGMLHHLDPHSDLLDRSHYQALQRTTTGRYAGIGMMLRPDGHNLRVLEVVPGGPAERGGVKAGDRVLAVGTHPVASIGAQHAVEALRGKQGTLVTLMLSRSFQTAEHRWHITLRRTTVHTASVTSRTLADGVGYVHVRCFNEHTDHEMITALTRLQHQRLRALVLDLRDNPGGLVTSAAKTANLFLDSQHLKLHQTIVSTQGRGPYANLTLYATPGDVLTGQPMVVLTNAGTASAAEILAGALQDHHRAVLVGTRTYGKGSIQAILPIGSDEAVKLTTALYLTPSGRSIQASGIEPDVVVPFLRMPAIPPASMPITEQRLAGHLEASPHAQPATRHPDASVLEQLASEDFQLYQAVQVVTAWHVVANTSNHVPAHPHTLALAPSSTAVHPRPQPSAHTG